MADVGSRGELLEMRREKFEEISTELPGEGPLRSDTIW